MDIVNRDYYQQLIEKYGKTNNELLQSTKFVDININFFDRALNQGLNLMVQIPSSYQKKPLLFANILLHLFTLQCLETKKPQYEVGLMLKDRSYKRGSNFRIAKINGDQYTLKEEPRKNTKNYFPVTRTIGYEELENNFVIIKRGIQRNRLNSLSSLFNKLYGIDYIPSSFGSKSVVICRKIVWNSLMQIEIHDGKINSNLQNLLPSIYLSKKGREASISGIDPALYFVPDYQTAYEHILRQGTKISCIVLLDCKLDSIPQMIMDQREHNFRMFCISTQNIENEGVKTWRWLKEEIEMINSL